MSIHKLTAGSGYDYLTRQVAALDATEKGHTGLASYYTARGETPGRWVGSGMAGVDGLTAGDVVTAEQMQALFGSGHHPLASQRLAQLQNSQGTPVAALTDEDLRAATRLGAPFKVYAGDVSGFRIEVARRIAAVNTAAGLPADAPVLVAERGRVRTEVGREFFVAEHGREPTDARELAAQIATESRPRTTAVAGYDLTFSPVKSVSTLWAVADPAVAARVEIAHAAAVKDALAFLEQRAVFTRTGTNGVRQVDVRGMVATAFTHRDSRAGDPDLHTHVAVANKVQTADGRWLSIDGRVLFKATVAASETYNTALERHLHDGLGLRFTERPNPDPRLRPVREVVGIDPALTQRWSARRASITARTGVLAADFQAAHGRPPTPVEAIQLGQQATLETRDAKHEPRTLAEQRATWRAQAIDVLGSHDQVQQMVRQALSPPRSAEEVAGSAWFAAAADRVLHAMQARRSTWQTWHVRAEAHRQIRATDLPTDQTEAAVDRLVRAVLRDRSVSLARPDPITEPALLCRADGASVYTVAGADLFTSATVLAAEQRLVDAAGRRDGRAVDPSCVDAALRAAAAEGVPLNAGQGALVTQMATSGARVQLAIAPAGAGKTTALRALAAAWTAGGGAVVGLAPSAAAAAGLAEQIDTRTDTLAKLTWSLRSGRPEDVPGWVDAIGPSTLVLIDEAGMADTLSLDTAVQYVLARGSSVRLIGDDQQLAAIGAGGGLRDIQTTHGAVHLDELLRFADPAEGAATLALRAGQPEALGFYLDNNRVHVGDLTTVTEEVFAGWQADRGTGLDSIMLAPTRDLVRDLNARAQAHRHASTFAGTGSPTTGEGRVVRLADGNTASVGDLLITRNNDRTLRTSATDWVKNGDRWTLHAIDPGGALTVQHTRTRRTVRLPAAYVEASVELGYATTIHTAQGVSVDTMHGLASGSESRQLLYTMLTRGRQANHVYLQVVGDGDPHTVIRPETVHPATATDLLEQILARDDAARSATTLQRDQDDPATQLGTATARYLDALYVAAEDTTGRDVAQALDATADRIVPGLSEEPAWPALRAHLLLLAAHGNNPFQQLGAAADHRELGTAGDQAAVLDWRLDDTGMRNAGPGPLPWLPAIPPALSDHPEWGDYLTRRARRVVDLAAHVHETAQRQGDTPGWAQDRGAAVPPDVLGDTAVWRAASQVDPHDRRPTGPPQLAKAAATWQRALDRRVTSTRGAALSEFGDLIEQAAPGSHTDAFTPVLADRLAAISRAGINTRALVHQAVSAGPLPDDHASAALWWRISRHLSPAVAARIDRDHHLGAPWAPHLTEILGGQRAQSIQASAWWPALVATVDHALHRGWHLHALLGAGTQPAADEDDECQALLWRTSLLLDASPDDPDEPLDDGRPEDLWEGAPSPDHTLSHAPENDERGEATRPNPVEHADLLAGGNLHAEFDDTFVPGLALAALLRDVLGPPEQTDAEIDRMIDRAVVLETSPVPRNRMLAINQLTLDFFKDQYPNSWGQRYLAERLGTDLLGDNRFQPGQAPNAWTALVDHLRAHGVSDTEMVTTGVVSTARTGRLIDRFRDRVVFPIVHHGQILGFVGRRHPNLADTDNRGPKYLNTGDTPLFHKGAQLFGDIVSHVAAGAIPVLVEGPLDAIAVTIATGGTHVGAAPLGTSLTTEHAAQLGALSTHPVVATDADIAGHVAAERAYWMLTPHGLDPTHARFPDGSDPADLLRLCGPEALRGTLRAAGPLADVLIQERAAHLPTEQAQAEAIRIVAGRPPNRWGTGIRQIGHLGDRHANIQDEVSAAVRHWNRDPRAAAQEGLQQLRDVRDRLAHARAAPPPPRWETVAHQLDSRLTHQGDWPALVTVMQDAHDRGHDVAAAARLLLDEKALGEMPAQDLRYRLVSQLGLPTAVVMAPKHASGGVGLPLAHRRVAHVNLRRSPQGPGPGPERPAG